MLQHVAPRVSVGLSDPIEEGAANPATEKSLKSRQGALCSFVSWCYCVVAFITSSYFMVSLLKHQF